jgi:polynucleotide 5'-hydroxyl-kinase GRC3/NOL9
VITPAIDIPSAWSQIEFHRLEGIILIIGGPDTGKSTFARYLYRQLGQARRPAAFVDGDPGQSLLGPPTTLTLVVSVRELGETRSADLAYGRQDPFLNGLDLPPITGCRRSFVGSVSPTGHLLPMLLGAERLARAGRALGAQVIVYDTCGLVEPGQGGLALKLGKIELLRPSLVVGIQREQELEPVLIPVQRSGKAEVVRLKPSKRVEPRSRVVRQKHRAEQLARYFNTASLANLDWRKLAVFPGPQFSLNRVLAFEDREGHTLGLGIIREIDRQAGRLAVLTPLGLPEGVRAIRLGDMAVDPETFEATMA